MLVTKLSDEAESAQRLLAEAREYADVDPQVAGDYVTSLDAQCPYYRWVPKDLDAQIDFREAIIGLGSESRDNAHIIWCMCARDILFWTNLFVFTYDPGQERNVILEADDLPLNAYPAMPMDTWAGFQDEAILKVNSCIGRRDLCIKKSRDMTATWDCLIAIAHRFQFSDLLTFLCLSRTEDAVDKRDDPDALFWKLDFVFFGNKGEGGQPGWLLGDVDRKYLHFGHGQNGSTIDGGATANDAGRGGRRTAILLDEFASVLDGYSMLEAAHDATACVIVNSTPKGIGNAFYDVAHNDGIEQLVLHWSQHPLKSVGLYEDENGKKRSPWYDLQCRRAVHPRAIGQELDIDFLTSDFQLFDGIVIQRCEQRDCRDPFFEGSIEFDTLSGEPTGLTERRGGPLRLWFIPDVDGRPPQDRDYVFGIDVGAGATNSVVSIGDRKTLEKVGEFAAPMDPTDFAPLACALGRWFCDDRGRHAYLIWESNGPGGRFQDRLLDLGYKNYFFRRDEDSISGKITDRPGWYSTDVLRERLLGEYQRALKDGEFTNRSWIALEECKQYTYTKDGRITNSRSEITKDPSGAKSNHSDRVIADALLWKVLKGIEIVKTAAEVRPIDSLGGRRDQRLRREQTRAKRERWLSTRTRNAILRVSA